VRDGRRLRQAEALDDDRTRNPLEFMDDLHGQGGAPRKTPLQTGQVRLLEIGVAQHPDVHGGDKGREGGPELPDGLEERLRLGPGDEDIGPCHEDGKIHRRRQPENMEEREGPEHGLASFLELREPRRKLLHLLAQVGVGEHHPLGNTRRSAGVLVHGDVLEAHLRPRRVRAVSGNAVLPPEDIGGRLDIGGKLLFLADEGEEKALREGEIIPDGGVDDLFDLRLRPQIDHTVPEEIEGDEDLRARVVELVLQLPVGVQGVVHDGDGPDAEHGKIGRHAGDEVGKKDRHGVPLLHPEIGKARGEAVHRVLQLPVGHGVALEDQGGSVRELLRRPVQDVGHRDLFVFDALGDACLIAFQPRLLVIYGVFVGHRTPRLNDVRLRANGLG